ncbi:MAG: CPBP family intramembrane metalloprotease [Akkermansiaceae bacterium]|nr:CPBP family intramembrane metalloprotease [Akkermansiaceae bacterium]
MWVLLGALNAGGYMQWVESLGVNSTQDSVKLLQETRDPVVLVLMAFTAVIVAPVCEEIVFRGYVYPAAKKFVGPWCAGICSALVFSAAHGSLVALFPIFILGALLAWIYEKTGSLWATIAVHLCFNGATVAMQFAARFLNLPLDPPP